MELKFRVFGRIARPVAEVFEAVVNPDQLSQYFTTGGAQGRIEKGATVTWDFADFPGAFPVEVVDVIENGNIQIMKTRISEGQLLTILNNARKRSGQSTPVVIRGDMATKHEAIKRVMDICGKAGLWKIRFAALKEKA